MPRVRYVGSWSALFSEPEKTHARIVAGRTALAAGRKPDPNRGELTEGHVLAYEGRRLGGARPGGGNYPVTAMIEGTTIRELGPGEGLSKFYRWGPEPAAMVQTVSEADWRVIQELPEASHFRIEE